MRYRLSQGDFKNGIDELKVERDSSAIVMEVFATRWSGDDVDDVDDVP